MHTEVILKGLAYIVMAILLIVGLVACGAPIETPSGESSLADTTPPLITNVSARDFTETATTITWSTDEPATSQVEYGMTISYGSTTTSDEELVTNHSVTLTGLEADTTYHFKVRSKDASGNEGLSTDGIFTTAELSAPVIEVSGMISNDTTWSADYTYELVGNTGIPDGVTLTIEPGTRVTFNSNYRLQVEGTLIAQGRADTPIVFWVEESTGDQYFASGVEFTGNNQSDSTIEDCEFRNCWVFAGGASPLIQDNIFYDAVVRADGGSPVVHNNILEGSTITFMHPGGDVEIVGNHINEGGVLIWCSTRNPITISHNIIENASTAIEIHTRGDESILITHNVLRNSGTAINLQFGRTLSHLVDIQITNNDFVANRMNLSTHEYIISDIVATNNWWGTTDETQIQELIYDYYDDLNLPKVHWQPYLTSPVED